MKEKIFLVLVGFVFTGLGMYNLVLPVVGVSIFEIELLNASSMNEIRANYDGMHLFLGLFLIYGAFNTNIQRTALLVVVVFIGGLVLGLITSLIIDGSPNEAVWTLFFVEAVGFLVASALYFLRPIRGKNDT
jgi:ABC-type sugar transport system permease subunit